jgi:hypothetical protein
VFPNVPEVICLRELLDRYSQGIARSYGNKILRIRNVFVSELGLDMKAFGERMNPVLESNVEISKFKITILKLKIFI